MLKMNGAIAGGLIALAIVAGAWVGQHYYFGCSDLFKACLVVQKP